MENVIIKGSRLINAAKLSYRVIEKSCKWLHYILKPLFELLRFVFSSLIHIKKKHNIWKILISISHATRFVICTVEDCPENLNSRSSHSSLNRRISEIQISSAKSYIYIENRPSSISCIILATGTHACSVACFTNLLICNEQSKKRERERVDITSIEIMLNFQRNVYSA